MRLSTIEQLRPQWRGAWARSNIFRTCGWNGCSGLMIRGLCQICGHAIICAYCKRTKQPDGRWLKVPHVQCPENESHGCCIDCAIREFPEIMAKRALMRAG
jgi:hypothetical protein